MTSAANARHARPRARTLRRARGRTVAALGFAALTWAGLTGTAMALDGTEQPADQTSGQTVATTAPRADATKPGMPLGDAVGSLTDDAVRGVTNAAGAITSETATTETASQSQPSAADEPAEATPAQDGPAPTDSSGSAGLLDSTVRGLTTYAVPQSSTTEPADNPATETQPASTQARTGELSILALVGGAEGAVNDLSGGVLTSTQLDRTLPAPKVNVLTNTLDALAVSDSLPTVPLSPVIGEPVNQVLGTLPADVSSGVVPALSDLSGGLVTPLPVPSTGGGLPVPQSPETLSPQSEPTIGAIPALPILLPFQTFPGLSSSDSPATFASLADSGAGDTLQDDVYLSRALLETSGDAAGDSSVPLPSGPHSPAGGPDGGSGSSHQQGGGQLSSFTLPGGGLVSLVRDYRWHLPATPTFDPGFSPD